MSSFFEYTKLNLERTIQNLITKKSEFIYSDNQSIVPENKTYSVYYLTDKSKLYFTNLITSNLQYFNNFFILFSLCKTKCSFHKIKSL